MLERCLEKNPTKRITSRDLLEHAFFAGEEKKVVRREERKVAEFDLSSHGLSQEGPVTIEGIIRGCFSNSGRKQHPEFFKNIGWTWLSLLNENESAEYWINLIPAKTREKFNSEKLNLHTPELWSSDQHELQPFLQSIKDCKWCGPYKADDYPNCYFVSINNSGDNEYYVCLLLNLSHDNPKDHWLCCLEYFKNDTIIGGSDFFNF